MIPQLEDVEQLKWAVENCPDLKHEFMPAKDIIWSDPAFEFLRDSRPLPDQFMTRLIEELKRNPTAFGRVIRHSLSALDGGDR